MGDVARSESDVGRHNNVGATGLTYLILRYMRDGTSRGINSDKLLIEGFTPAQIGNETEALVNGRLLDGSKVTMQDSRHPVYLLKALTLAGRAHLEQLERALMSETADPALTLRAYYSLVLVSATKQAVAWVRSHGLASVLAALVPVAWGFFTRRSALPADVAGLRGALFAYAVLTTIALIIFALRVPVSLYNQQIAFKSDLKRRLHDLSESANSFDHHVVRTTQEFLRRHGERGRVLLRLLIMQGRTERSALGRQIREAGFPDDDLTNVLQYGSATAILRYDSPTPVLPKNLWSVNPDFAPYVKSIVFQERRS